MREPRLPVEGAPSPRHPFPAAASGRAATNLNLDTAVNG